MLDGRADAVIHEGRMKPAWRELGNTRKMRYLPVDVPILEELEKKYNFRKAVISQWMFPCMEADVPCVDFSEWLLFTHDDMPEDFIYLMTKTLIEKRDSLIEFHFRSTPRNFNVVTCPLDPAQRNKNIGSIPLHKGAERYYEEQGLL